MFFAAKIGFSGIVFLLLTTWISGPRPVPITSTTDLSNEVPEARSPNDVNKTQQILQDKGHYRGKIDGVLGLRTRASIRSFQKAESLQVTGQLDVQTADKLGVTPEIREEIGSETARDKPSAGIKHGRESNRIKTPRKPARK